MTATELKTAADALLDNAGLTPTGKPKRAPKTAKPAEATETPPKAKKPRKTLAKATEKATAKKPAAKTKPDSTARAWSGFHAASTVAKKVKGFTFATTESGQLRTESGSYSLTALIKWAAGAGYSRKQIVAVCELLMGVTPDSSTLGCHSTAGRFIANNPGVKAPHHHGPVATLSSADKAQVKTKVGKPGADVLDGDDE